MIYILLKILLSIVCIPLCGLFSAMAGSEKFAKAWRRFGIPLLLSVLILSFNFNLWYLSVLLIAFPYSKGHGIPSPDDDTPSSLGAFFYKITGENEKFTNILLRLTKGILKSLPCLTFPLITGNWIIYIIASLIIITGNVLFGGDSIIKGEGTFSLFKTEMLWEEFIIAAIDSAGILSIAFIN